MLKPNVLKHIDACACSLKKSIYPK